MNRFQSSAAGLAGSLGLVLAFAAPSAKAEPTAAQLHAQVTAQQKLIETMKARLDRLEAGGASHGAVREPKKFPANAPKRKRSPRAAAGAKMERLSAQEAALKAKLAERSAARGPAPHLKATSIPPNLEADAMTVPNLQKSVKALWAAVSDLTANQAAIAASLAAQGDATSGQIQLLATAQGQALKNIDSNLAVLQDQAERAGRSLDEVAAWQDEDERNLVHIISRLSCQGFPALTQNLEGWIGPTAQALGCTSK